MGSDEKACPRCAETVKVAATVCKHCGHEFQQSAAAQPAEPKKRSKFVKIAGYVALGFIGLMVLGAIVGPADEQAGAASDEAKKEAVAAEALEVTAQELFEAYKANEMAAQKKYGGQPVKISGVIEAIELDVMDNPTVSLQSGHMFLNVMLHFDKSYGDKTAELAKGQRFTAVCSDVSEVIGAPQLSKCQF